MSQIPPDDFREGDNFGRNFVGSLVLDERAAGVVNQALGMIRRLENLQTVTPLFPADGPGGRSISLDRGATCWGRITVHPGLADTFVQVSPDGSGGWADTTGGFSGHAYEVGGSHGSALDGKVVRLTQVGVDDWRFQYPTACYAPSCWVVQDSCGKLLEGVTVSLAPVADGVTAPPDQTTDASGKTCFANLTPGDYTLTLSGLDTGYTNPGDIDVTVSQCGGTGVITVWPAPGNFLFGTGSTPRTPPKLYLCTPYGRVPMEVEYIYGLQQPSATPNTALVSWEGGQVSKTYQVVRNQDIDGNVIDYCTVFDKNLFRLHYWPCGYFGLEWQSVRCHYPQPNPDPPPNNICNPENCDFVFGAGRNFPDYEQTPWDFWSAGNSGFCGFRYTDWPVGQSALGQLTSDTIDADFSHNLGVPKFASGCGVSGGAFPGWCCSVDGGVISTWHLALNNISDPVNGNPTSPGPLEIPLSLHETGGCGDGGVGTVFARGSGTNPGAAGWTGYAVTLNIEHDRVWVVLKAYVSGLVTILDMIGGDGGGGIWYGVGLNCTGSTINVTLQRRSDSFYLQTDGSWAASSANALSVTDSSVSGAGYLGIGLEGASTLIESDDLAIPAGYSVEVDEHWDSSTAPALPTGSFIYTGSLVTDADPPVPPLSDPNVLEAASGQSGYAAFNTTDDSTGDVSVSAWFCIPPGGYYGSDLPASITVTFDSSVVWGDLAGTTITIDYDAGLGDYPSACLTTTTDGGNCDGSGATEGLLTVTLTVVSSGVVDAVAQWSGGTHGTDCADGACGYYGVATGDGIPEDNSPAVLTFPDFTYTAGGSGSFVPGESLGTPYVQDWDAVTAPAMPSDFNDCGGLFFTSTTFSLSGTNSLTLSPNDGMLCSLRTPSDGSGGDVIVEAAFLAASLSGSGYTARVFCRSSPTLDCTNTGYYAEINLAVSGSAGISLQGLSGAPTSVGTAVAGVTFSAGVWYRVKLKAAGSRFEMTVQRLSDSLYLQPDGTWGSADGPCCAGTNTDLATEGYAGVGIDNTGHDLAVYCDDFKLTPITAPGTPATITLQVPTP